MRVLETSVFETTTVSYIQSTLVISTSVISNNRLSRREKSDPFFHLCKFGCSFSIFLNSANLICRSTDISKCFRGSLRLRGNVSRLYVYPIHFYIRDPGLQSFFKVKVTLILRCEISKVVFHTLYQEYL